MTRGNQRELDRLKNLKKQQGQAKSRQIPEGTSLQNVKHHDAEIMRKKQAEALARKNATEATGKPAN